MWTKEQKEAIDSRDKNLLVSAAAGSGKTAVLVARIKKLIIEEKASIDKFLIVTFTNTAAGEMKERVLKELLKELKEENGDNSRIREQIGLLNKSNITTIHSFCMNMLKKYFYKIDIDLNFRIGDITETEILLQESLNEVIEAEYEYLNEDFINLVENFTEDTGDIKLENMLIKLYRFTRSQPDPEIWMKEKIEYFNIEKKHFKNNTWILYLVEHIKERLTQTEDLINEAIRFLDCYLDLEAYNKVFSEDLNTIKNLIYIIQDMDIEKFQKELEGFSFKRLKAASKDIREKYGDEIEKVKKLRDNYKDIIKDLKSRVFIKSLDKHIAECLDIKPTIEYLCRMVINLETTYINKKREKNILDFNDLEHFVLKLLKDNSVREEIKEYFDYIFVDEYQDSNIVQETIVNAISKENNKFLVGDIKQSIYRFRLADPTLFINKYREYKLKNSLNHKVDLYKNFRSRKEILDGINFLFKNIMSEELGEIDYTEDIALNSGASYEDIYNNNIELNIVDKKLEKEDKDLQNLESAEIEGKFIANKIKDIIGKKTYDIGKKEYRNIEYRDIVILLRANKNWSDVYEQVLTQESIPIYIDDTSGYFSSMEIRIFLSLLSLIDNKRQDIELLTVLRSPIVNISIEELIEIREVNKESSYFICILEYIRKNSDTQLGRKLGSFLDNLSMWKDESRDYDLDEFIWKVLRESNYYNYVGCLPNGNQRKANLELLMDKAKELQKTSISGLFNFLKFSKNLKDIKGDMGTAKIMGENENVVRIMSIHKSKGLEFPIVICGGLGKQFNLIDTRADFVLHKDLGIGAKYVNWKDRTWSNSLAEVVIKEKMRIEALSEEMRILYVALTRAKDKLILYGTINGIEKSIEKWSRECKYYNLSQSKTMLDWICMAIDSVTDLDKLVETREIKTDENWEINYFKVEDTLEEKRKKELDDKIKKKILLDYKEVEDSKLYEYIDSKFRWEYPYILETKTPSKVSVSYLSEKEKQKDIYLRSINMISKETSIGKYSGAEIGTINHRVLELLDFDKNWDILKLEKKLDELEKEGILLKEEKEVVDIYGIESFFKSEIYKRILASNIVRKEKSFVYNKKQNIDYYIQGIVDCYFEEENGIILIDYKSDRLSYKENFIKLYNKQINLYEEALEEITGKKVKEKYIFSLYMREFIEV